MEKKQSRQTRSSPSSSSSTSTSTMKTSFCIPRFRTSSRKSTGLSPMSLLDRFREAVFRLIMLSAISKVAATAKTDHHQDSRTSSSSSNSPANYHWSCYYHQSNDLHHSEAVADCIEFINRSANDRDSIDSTAEVVVPLPVM